MVPFHSRRSLALIHVGVATYATAVKQFSIRRVAITIVMGIEGAGGAACPVTLFLRCGHPILAIERFSNNGGCATSLGCGPAGLKPYGIVEGTKTDRSNSRNGREGGRFHVASGNGDGLK